MYASFAKKILMKFAAVPMLKKTYEIAYHFFDLYFPIKMQISAKTAEITQTEKAIGSKPVDMQANSSSIISAAPNFLTYVTLNK